MKNHAAYALALAVLFAAAPAQAATLKAESTVTGDTFTVGDVFAGAGVHADRYLGPAPLPGRTLTLSAHDLMRISSAFGLGWTPGVEGAQAVIRREATSIGAHAVQAALEESLAQALGGARFEMDLAGRAPAFVLPGTHDKTVRVDNLKVDLQKGRFTATVAAPAENPVATQAVSGALYMLTRVPVLSRPLRPDDIIGASDIQYIDMRADDVSANTVVDGKKLIGMAPRRGIPALRPVMASDIAQPRMVKKGDLVTVVMQSGAISLTMQARALQHGAEGDTVRIVNTASNRTLEATVTGPQTVSVTAPSAAL